MTDLNSVWVPATYLASFLDDATLDPQQRAVILARAPINMAALCGEQARISLSDLLETLTLIDEVSPPGWHIRPILALQAAHHGPLGVAVVTAARLSAAIDCLVRFESLRSPWTVLQAGTTHAPAGLGIRVLPVVSLPPPGDLLMEMNLIALAALIGELCGRQRQRLKIDLPPRYRPWAGQLARSLPGEIDFEARQYQIWLPGELLALPCLLADSNLHTTAMMRCEALLGRDHDIGPTATRVQQLLMAMNGRNPGLPAIARQLGQTERTLIRRLEKENSSYRALVDRVRQTLACDWLKHGNLPVSQIAELLGYRDPANFGRAFRRWTGTSPGAFRGR